MHRPFQPAESIHDEACRAEMGRTSAHRQRTARLQRYNEPTIRDSLSPAFEFFRDLGHLRPEIGYRMPADGAQAKVM